MTFSIRSCRSELLRRLRSEGTGKPSCRQISFVVRRIQTQSEGAARTTAPSL